jgi:hypothetical protein
LLYIDLIRRRCRYELQSPGRSDPANFRKDNKMTNPALTATSPVSTTAWIVPQLIMASIVALMAGLSIAMFAS